MEKQISVREVEKALNEDFDDAIIVKRENKEDVVIISLEEYKKIWKEKLVDKLKISEEQIENGEVVSAEEVFANLREKFGY